MSAMASATVAAAVTSNPSCDKMTGKVIRIESSSSTKSSLGFSMSLLTAVVFINVGLDAIFQIYVASSDKHIVFSHFGSNLFLGRFGEKKSRLHRQRR
jgi:chloramphenicol 3-O-phosphotransferase